MEKADRLLKRKVTPADMDSVKERQSKLRSKEKDVQLLMRCHRAWDNLDPMRMGRARALRFTYGDQLADVITVNGKQMTYRQYLMQTGNVAIQTNQIKNRVDTIVGVMTKEKNEPVCHAIDRQEQRFGEVVTEAVQANCDKNIISELYIKFMKDIICGGVGVAYEAYDRTSNPCGRLDSWTLYVDPVTWFYESEGSDPRGWDINLIGRFYYYSKENLCAQFVKRPEDYDILRSIYPNQFSVFRTDKSQFKEDDYDDNPVFMDTADPLRCYVCEVWTRETRAKMRLWDTNSGKEEIIFYDDYDYRKAIKAENERRRELGLASGWSEDEISYIVGDGFGRDESERNGMFLETYWYCRFLAPDGTILWEGESPYADKQHPFSMCLYPYMDGRISGFIYDAIDHNMAMNRALILNDWLIRTQAKGVTVVPKSIVPDDVTYEEFANSWTSIDDMVYIDLKPGMENMFPKVFYGAAQHYDVSNLLTTLQHLMDSGSPVNGALQGKTPNSGTSGTLYAQMASNASTPIAGLMDSFHTFVREILTKKMKNIVNFYDIDRFEKISGNLQGALGDAAPLNLNEIKDLEYDLRIKESADTPVYRAVINQDAKEFVMAGLISFDEYLQIADVPYADKLLQQRQAQAAEAGDAAQQGVVSPAAAAASMPAQTPQQAASPTDTTSQAPPAPAPRRMTIPNPLS